jgi:branched-chain amino acid transport system ATP-binding protein
MACRDLSAGYSDVVAFRHLDLELSAGRITALLGPNGAGKTTALRTLAGLLPPITGTLILDGQPLARSDPCRMNRAGVVLVPDSRELFTRLSVRDNLAVASRGDPSAVDEAIELFPQLRDRLGLAAGALSGGEQQMVALARALVQRPRVLLIDEMSTGLAPIVLDGLLEIVTSAARRDAVALLLVEQHVPAALAVADDVVVLAHGHTVLAVPASTLRSDPTSIESAYLGGRDVHDQ